MRSGTIRELGAVGACMLAASWMDRYGMPWHAQVGVLSLAVLAGVVLVFSSDP